MKEQGGAIIEQTLKDYADLGLPHEPEEQDTLQDTPKGKKRPRSAKVQEDAEILNESEKDNNSEISSPPANISNVSNGSTVSGGVNRRTAVLFTRKAKARANRGQVRTTPENENKKQSDSFKVYR